MKKILILLIALGSVAAVQAQTSRDEARRVILGQPRNGNRTVYSQGRTVIVGNNRAYPRNVYHGNNYGYGRREGDYRNYGRQEHRHEGNQDNGRHNGWYKGNGNDRHEHGQRGEHHD